MSQFIKGSHAILATASCMLFAVAGQAQTPASTDAASTAADPEDIIVTAQRRSETLQDVPISITAASAGTLQRQGITRLDEISQIAPGVQISRTGIYNQPAIRGVTTAQAATPENNVAIYIDGFYLPSSRGLNVDLVNISQIQVLKGPQGTLFGRNATGGAILIETLQPSLTDISGKVSAAYGRFDDVSLQGYLTVPIVTDKLAFNIASSYRKSDGYIRDVAGFDTAPLKSSSIRAKLLLQPSDEFSATVAYNRSRVNDPRALSTTNEGFALAKVISPGSYVETRDNRTSQNHPTINRSVEDSVSLKAAYDFGPATLTSFTYFQDERDFSNFEGNDGSPLPIYDQFFDERYKTTTQEVNLTSSTEGRLQYVVGAFFFDSNVSHFNDFARSVFSATPSVYVLQTRYQNFTKAYAVYADATYELVDNLFLTGGLRYSHERKRLDTFAPVTGAPTSSTKLTFGSTTPRAVVRYEFAPRTNVYASFSKGFKSGLVNTSAPFLPVAPEKITAYEVGFKAAPGRFNISAAAFDYEYKNLQVSSIAIIGATSSAVITNAATARIYGAEAQLSGRITDRLNLNAGVAYTHARYRSFPNAPVNLLNAAGLNSGTCPNPSPPPATRLCTQDFSGRRMLRAPDWMANLGGDYTIPVSFGEITLSGNVSYQSFQVLTRSDAALSGSGYRYGDPARTLLNLTAAWTSSDDRFRVSLFGQNVTDEKYFIVHSGTAFGDYHVFGTPATYGLRVDYNF